MVKKLIHYCEPQQEQPKIKLPGIGVILFSVQIYTTLYLLAKT